VPDAWTSIVGIVLAVGLVLVLLTVVFGGSVTRRGGSGRHAASRPARARFHREGHPAPPPKRAALIVNPTKVESVGVLRDRLAVAAARLGWAVPDVVETTVADPGYGQARQALADGVDVVCVLGGDGTVRAVAQVMAGSGTPMGLLPGGTGNLLARNLTVPTTDVVHALEVALTGRNRHVDLGWVTVARPEPDEGRPPEEPGDEPRAFAVMAGLGFDATIMDETSEELKAKVGWAAYVASGFRNLRGARFKAQLRVDDGEPVTRRARTVLVGNCGKLTGGIVLMPDAEVDDGVLDVVAITPKGLPGWARVAAHVLRRRGDDHAQLDRWRGQRIRVRVEEPQQVQLDGDVIGEATEMLVEVRPRALIVRVGTPDPSAREQIEPDVLADLPADLPAEVPAGPR
jgi:diacylglycerol kinase family enzyme